MKRLLICESDHCRTRFVLDLRECRQQFGYLTGAGMTISTSRDSRRSLILGNCRGLGGPRRPERRMLGQLASRSGRMMTLDTRDRARAVNNILARIVAHVIKGDGAELVVLPQHNDLRYFRRHMCRGSFSSKFAADENQGEECCRQKQRGRQNIFPFRPPFKFDT